MTTKEAIVEMMNAWNKVENEAKVSFPTATAEEIYQICKTVLNTQLGITK